MEPAGYSLCEGYLGGANRKLTVVMRKKISSSEEGTPVTDALKF